jgi:hypothetical protein
MPLPSERVYNALWESVFDHQHQYHWEHLELDTCDPEQFLAAADEIVARMQQILKHFQILRNYQAGRLLVRSGMTQSEVLDEYNVSTFRQRILVHTYQLLRKMPFAISGIRGITPAEIGSLNDQLTSQIELDLINDFNLQEPYDDDAWPYENDTFNRLVSLFQGPISQVQIPINAWPQGFPVPANVRLVSPVSTSSSETTRSELDSEESYTTSSESETLEEVLTPFTEVYHYFMM